VKLQAIYDAQRERGVPNSLHRSAVPVTRDSDGCAWNEATKTWVDPKKAPAVVAPAEPPPAEVAEDESKASSSKKK